MRGSDERSKPDAHLGAPTRALGVRRAFLVVQCSLGWNLRALGRRRRALLMGRRALADWLRALAVGRRAVGLGRRARARSLHALLVGSRALLPNLRAL